jgi:hypothetical protein
MVEKWRSGPADKDEERQQIHANEGGHASHEKGAAHEFNDESATNGANSGPENGAEQSERRTRGGTHDQHVTAGKKGGSRIRQLIELGYKYEQEHGIGPGQNERSKLAAKRRSPQTEE